MPGWLVGFFFQTLVTEVPTGHEEKARNFSNPKKGN